MDAGALAEDCVAEDESGVSETTSTDPSGDERGGPLVPQGLGDLPSRESKAAFRAAAFAGWTK